jgi:UDP-N-acetylmuramoylalanine--D-glutamate ligase
MDELVKRCAPRIKAAILIGKDRDVIKDSLTQFAPDIPTYLIDFKESKEALLI